MGRTGAGKSSLLQALFRLIEPSSGSIKIDNTDIQSLGLLPLRGRALSVLPQMPFISQALCERTWIRLVPSPNKNSGKL